MQLYFINYADFFQLTFAILICQEKKDASSWSREMECNDW